MELSQKTLRLLPLDRGGWVGVWFIGFPHPPPTPPIEGGEF
jgi:hypothetical protein